MLRPIALHAVVVSAIAAFVVYGEYLVWFQAPMSQIAAICDDFRALENGIAAQGTGEPFHLIDEASEGRRPARLVERAVRACDGLPALMSSNPTRIDVPP